jgi:hypothetical protein
MDMGERTDSAEIKENERKKKSKAEGSLELETRCKHDDPDTSSLENQE